MVEAKNDSDGGEGEGAFGFVEEDDPVAEFKFVLEKFKTAVQKLDNTGFAPKLARCVGDAVATMNLGLKEHDEDDIDVAAANTHGSTTAEEPPEEQLKLAAVNSRLLERNAALEAAQEKIDEDKEEADGHAKNLAKPSWLLTLVGMLTCGL